MTTKSQAAAEEYTKEAWQWADDSHYEGDRELTKEPFLAGWQAGRLEMVKEATAKSYIVSQAIQQGTGHYWMVRLTDIEELGKEGDK